MTAPAAGVILRHVRDLAGTDRDSSSPDADLLQRFTSSRDSAAFAELVRRHGGLVLGVCRRVLGNAEDAEDAFQATFLVLARKAASIGRGASLPAWLYRVAYRLALRARRQVCCRRQREQLAEPRGSGDCLQELTGRELLQVLDEEMQRLPEGERAALVLCYLQGKPRDEAAALLGWSLSTLKRRLEQARRRLHLRLERRGLTLPAALAVVGLADAAEAAVPAALATTTARAVLAPEVLSTRAGLLASAALRGMALAKAKVAGALVLLAAVLAVGVGLLAQPAPPPSAQAAKADGKAPAPPAAPRDDKRVTIAGRVLDADGKPVAEADVVVLSFPHNMERIAEEDLRFDVLGQTRSDAKGRFRLRAEKRDPIPSEPIPAGQMLIHARGHGLGLHAVALNGDHDDERIRLPRERVLRGRLIDLQGAPIKGLTVPLLAVTGSRNEQPLKAVGRPAKNVPGWPGAPKTDEEGRFVIRGLGEGQSAVLLVRDERFKVQPVQLPAEGKDPAREVVTVLAPAPWIEGRVTYADTGKPAVGAEVYAETSRTRTDRDGRYRITPYHEGGGFFAVAAPAGTPYIAGRRDLPPARGGTKRVVDVKLIRGLLVSGKVVEEGGKPIVGAGIYYLGRQDNPNKTNEMVWGDVFTVFSDAKGAFQIPVIPGKGQLLVNGPAADYLVTETGYNQLSLGKPGGERYYVHAVAPLDLPAGEDPAEVVVKLRRGVTVEGKLTGPGGQPVKDALVVSRLTTSSPYHRAYQAQELPLRGAHFIFRGCHPDKGLPAVFLDEEHQWGTIVSMSGKQAGKFLTVRLEPCGSAVARFVDGRGKPLPQLPVSVELLLTSGPQRYDYARRDRELAADSIFPPGYHNVFRNRRMLTDGEGRFTFPMLVPGAAYRIHWREGDKVCVRDFKVGPEERLDLKDVVIHRE